MTQSESETTKRHGPRVVVLQLDAEPGHVESYGPFADRETEHAWYEANKDRLTPGWTFHFMRMGDPDMVTKATHLEEVNLR